MAWNYYDAGIGHVASYQASGHPWLSGSTSLGGANMEVEVSFPYVTKSITVAQSGSGNLRVHFAPTGSMEEPANCYWELNSNEDAITMNVKCAKIYLSVSSGTPGVQIMAELTRIDTDRMWNLTGSGINE